ncbi:PAQR family membrane homeostasis protein TrhA [Mariniblastus fucicola]|uniref:Hemolysin-III related n=1 Tax=Mariniblastus fucicola TaxID=980251 RepID=A0A5B9PFS4_9BACT|nr:hemolysin III family protein [Mariniblastus fucicola]QEG23486.1 hemolysin-III related [Mariniblastus fucicola]
MVRRDAKEEKWNAGTHFFGMILAFAGLVWMGLLVRESWPSVPALACVVYASLLVLMYMMSTLSHSFAEENKLRRFRALDQASIFLLITGTYTPLSVHFWNTFAANSLLLIMWAISISGFVAKVFFSHRVNRVSVIGFVALGWMPIVGLPFHEHWPVQAMLWVLVGGIVYSLGTIFLLNDQKAKWCHPAWHLSVIAASAIHFGAVVKFVAMEL